MRDQSHEQFLAAIEPAQGRLYRYALAVMGDKDDAKDLVGDTLLAAYERFETLREPEKILHLLLTIASRKSKRRKYRSQKFVKLDASLTELIPNGPLKEEAAAELAVLLDLLQQLPARIRQTVILFEVEDLSLNAIQKVQGGTLSGVKSRLKRGREGLARLARDRKGTEYFAATENMQSLERRASHLLVTNSYAR